MEPLLFALLLASLAFVLFAVRALKRRWMNPSVYEDTWESDRAALRTWDRIHRFGPLTEEDRIERNDLQLFEIGSYLLYRLSYGQKIFNEYSNWKIEQVQDQNWRE